VDFFLFILVNATLFLRPAELFPSMAEVPLYNILIVLCLASALPQTLDQLSLQRLMSRPISACVVAMIPAIMLSHLSHFDTWSAREYAIEFLKVVIYYLLLVGIVNTPGRLKSFLTCIVVFTVITSALAFLQYYEYIDIPSLSAMEQWEEDPVTGERFLTHRLRATGIFNDPNDLSMIVVVAITIGLMNFFDRSAGASRSLWSLPLAALGFTLVMTQSRGGLLALLAALLTLVYSRYGGRKAILAALVLVPAPLLLLSGRQADLGGALSGGTGEARVELWAAGLQELKTAPIFGIGMNNYGEAVGQVAHNSFVHCFVELGLVGGLVYFGAFFWAIRSTWRLNRDRSVTEYYLNQPFLARLQPYLLAVLAAFAVSQMSLSRSYVVVTYTMLGLAASNELLSRRIGHEAPVKLSFPELRRLAVAGCGFIAAIYVYIRIGFR
jgi:hypothetical protein